MLSIERKLKIADIVGKSGGIKTSELSNIFNVSEMTILRDLSTLEEEGILKRVYGGAVNVKDSSGEISSIIRRHIHPQEKNIIAEKAMKYISPGESIFLDGSTTALALAKKIAELQIDITVISNGLDIVNELKADSLVKVICPGGELNRTTHNFVGPDTENYMKELYADKSFISPAALSLKSGITVENPVQAAIKKIMIRNSLKKIMIVDSSKFDNTSLSKICEIKDIDIIITDEKPEKQYLKFFKDAEVGIIY
jgi:DeoR/GlpR family transcriptional regulator of sugar metabolism